MPFIESCVLTDVNGTEEYGGGEPRAGGVGSGVSGILYYLKTKYFHVV